MRPAHCGGALTGIRRRFEAANAGSPSVVLAVLSHPPRRRGIRIIVGDLPYPNPVLRLPLTLVGLLLPVATSPSVAQQREPRVEIYGLSGVYSTGISWAPFTPQAGAGVMCVPLDLGAKAKNLVTISLVLTFTG